MNAKEARVESAKGRGIHYSKAMEAIKEAAADGKFECILKFGMYTDVIDVLKEEGYTIEDGRSMPSPFTKISWKTIL